MRNINHIYVDWIFICPNNFSQIIIILGFAHIININNKTQIGYELVSKNFEKIITLNNNIKHNIESYTTDFEISLINAMKKIFNSSRGIGCLFHYSQALMRNLKTYGLYRKEYKNISDELLKKLIEIPFIYDNNNDII